MSHNTALADWLINLFRESQRVILGLVESVYQTFINTVTLMVPVLAPFPAAYSIYTAMAGDTINAPQEIAILTAVAVELIGIFQAKTALRARNWNLVKRVSDPPAPFSLALAMAMVYFVVGLLLTISIEIWVEAAQFIFPCFVIFAASVYIANAIASDLTRWETERDDRLREQEQRRGLAADLRNLREQLATVQSQLAQSETRAATLRDQIARDEAAAAALRDQVARLQSQRESGETETRRPPNGSLTRANESRQRQIAQRRERVKGLHAQGYSNSDIAAEEDISLDTVRRDLQAVEPEAAAPSLNGKVNHA